MSRAVAGALAVSLLAAFPAAALEVPYLSGRVVDEAGMMSPGTVEGVTATLEQLERDTGAQVAVLTLPSLEGEAIEDYSHRVAETWKLGREGEDDGVLFLVARDDRRMRIEVGYGLEGRIPDALAGRILDQKVRPRFRAGEFDAGIASGVGAVAALIRGEQAEAVVPAPSGGGSGCFAAVGCLPMLLWFFALFVVLPLLFGRKRRTFRVAGLPIVLGGLAAGSGRSGRSGGFGGFSGGGFSGGGGSFGGGGASSSW